MTRLECLREELIKKGYTKQQANSKVVVGVLEIVASGSYADENKILDEIQELETSRRVTKQAIHIYEQRYKSLRKCADEMEQKLKDAADRMYSEQKAYINSFFEALEECETPEGRDAMRTAQMFMNSVPSEKYDSAAFISGLAAILSRGDISPKAGMRLKRIDPNVKRLVFYPSTGDFESIRTL